MRASPLTSIIFVACGINAEVAEDGGSTSGGVASAAVCPAVTEPAVCAPPPERRVCPGDKPIVAPPGFPQEDEFPNKVIAACAQIAYREVTNDWLDPISDWCIHRVHNSSRGDEGNVVHSRIDGSQIHDRDRPAAWWFYEASIRVGRMDPEACEHHRIDKLAGHPAACFIMAKEWPFSRPAEIKASTQDKWFNHPHAMEEFGTRGPIDFNSLVGYDAIPGCYPFTAFDRNDVSVTALVRRSVRICAKFGCRTKWDIKAHWNDALR